MHATNVRAKQFQCRQWLARTIKNHIGRVEIHKEVFAIDILQEFDKRDGGLLPCFQMQGLIMRRTVIANFA